jgi:transcriptional regulator
VEPIKKLKENKEDTINNFEVVTRLQQIKEFLTELRDNLE